MPTEASSVFVYVQFIVKQCIIMKYINCLLVLNLLMLSACDADDGPSRLGSGRISVGLDVDSGVLSAAIPEHGETASVDEIGPDDFSLTMRSADGAFAKTWDRFSDFPVDGLYNIGDYVMEASYGSVDKEGFDAACYYGEQSLTVREAETTPVKIVCRLANSMVSVMATDAFKGYFSDYSTLIHSEGGEYLQYGKDELRPVYVRPGDVTFTVSVTNPDGQSASFVAPTPITALPRHYYRVKLDVNGGDMGTAKLVITFDDNTDTEDVVIDLSGDLMSSPAPGIFVNGFVSGQPFIITEGAPASTKLSATISAGAGIGKVILSSRVPSVQAAGLPSEFDLMAATDTQKSILEDMGLGVKGLWHNPDKMAEIDFTDFVAGLHPSDGGNLTFSLIAVDRYGKSSEPVSLIIDFNEVSLTASQEAPVIVGKSEAAIKITPSTAMADASRLTLSANISGRWVDLPVESVADNGDEWIVSFKIPAGTKDLPVRMLYNGVVKGEITMERKSPDFRLEADPFATSVVIKILNPDPDVAAAIARQVEIVDADGRKLHIVRRDDADAMVTVSGITPATSYAIKATALPGNSKAVFTEPVRFTTEKAASIPNGDFEEAKLIEEYRNLPSGGRYSQTHVGIYNHQNYWSTDLYLPEGGWATVNGKTMCKDVRHRNTWYQQLSSMIVNDCKSGSKAMRLTSVGWDVDGEPIKDYAQNVGEFLPYNPNVPHVAFRAAGKLFLGEYSYSASDNTEIYNEGISFGSRPSALTGYYKYLPAAEGLPLDKGCVSVVLYREDSGRQIVVASTVAELPLAPGYTSFNVPLRYPVFGLRPTHLKVMFSSSVSTGSIDHETANIPLVNDLRAGASRGSSLWIDNISFAY